MDIFLSQLCAHPLTKHLVYDSIFPTMKNITLPLVGALALALLWFVPSAQANPAGPSQQVVTVTGNGDLNGNLTVPAGTTRFWVIRLDGDGALSPRAVQDFRLVEAEEDQLTYESAASNSVPASEATLASIGVHHEQWSTTRVMLRSEVGGRIADGDSGKDPWISVKSGLNWPIYTNGNGAMGGLSLAANKPLGGPWVGTVGLDTNFEGATRGLSSMSGSDWQAIRFGFGLGQHRPYGARWSLGAGLDFGQYGVGAARPLYAKLEASRTALPGQPWEAAGQVLTTVGTSGVGLGANVGCDFRLQGPWTVGLSADANTDSDGAQVGAGPAFGVNIPVGKDTLRIRTGARLGIKKDPAGKTDGTITPFLQMGLQKGN